MPPPTVQPGILTRLRVLFSLLIGLPRRGKDFKSASQLAHVRFGEDPRLVRILKFFG